MPGAKKGCGAVIKNVLISFEDKDMFCKPFLWPCHSMRLFHLHSTVKIRPFFRFSLGGIHG